MFWPLQLYTHAMTQGVKQLVLSAPHLSVVCHKNLKFHSNGPIMICKHEDNDDVRHMLVLVVLVLAQSTFISSSHFFWLLGSTTILNTAIGHALSLDTAIHEYAIQQRVCFSHLAQAACPSSSSKRITCKDPGQSCLAPSIEPLRKTTAITCHCRGPCGYMITTPMPAYEFFSWFLTWKYLGRLAEVAGRQGNQILMGSRKILLGVLDFWNRSKKDCGSEEKRFFETCWCIPTDTGSKIQFMKLVLNEAGY